MLIEFTKDWRLYIKGEVMDLRDFAGRLGTAEILAVALEQRAQINLARLDSDKSLEEAILAWHLVASDDPASLAFREAKAALSEAASQLSQLETDLPTATTMEELPQPRPT